MATEYRPAPNIDVGGRNIDPEEDRKICCEHNKYRVTVIQVRRNGIILTDRGSEDHSEANRQWPAHIEELLTRGTHGHSGQTSHNSCCVPGGPNHQRSSEEMTSQYLLGPEQGCTGLQGRGSQGWRAMGQHRTQPGERKAPQARQPRHQHGHNMLSRIRLKCEESVRRQTVV
ncbi:hypothetical protein EYF80_005943 [Liparis tanakae]|uniref:Uncharacterized protein n=1 Tax=Liparis tanakae TaxID=230148 RepID=A0A4Z2J150_9TELE|nr:hypothetical protein EYF80_005943 [Liparis tanakae]